MAVTIRNKKPIVNHWRYDNGMRELPEILKPKNSAVTLTSYFSEEYKGWHCWFYTTEDLNIEEWMEENMSGEYECDFRFNSGNPMHTIFIKSDEDASLFKLKWL